MLNALGVRRFTPPSQLRTDQRSYPGQQLVSVNRACRLVLKRNGDLVTYGPGGAGRRSYAREPRAAPT